MERSTVMLKSLVCLILFNKILAAPTTLNDTQINNSTDDGQNRKENFGSFDVPQLKNGRKFKDSTTDKAQIRTSAYPFTFEDTHLSNALISSISILKDIHGDEDFNVKLNQPSSNTSSTIRIINHIHSGNNKTNGVKKAKESRDLPNKILNNTFDSILSKPVSSDVTADGRVVHKIKRIIPNRTTPSAQTSNPEAVLSVSRNSSINVNDSVTGQTTIINDSNLREDIEVSRRRGKVLNTKRLPVESESGLEAGHDSRPASQGHVESKNSHDTRNYTQHALDSYESLQGRSVPKKLENNKNTLIYGSSEHKNEDNLLNSLSDSTFKNTTIDSETAGDIKQSLISSKEFPKYQNKYTDQINTRPIDKTLPNENKKVALERELIALNVFKKLSELNDINNNSDKNENDYLSIDNVSGPDAEIPQIPLKLVTTTPLISTQNMKTFPTLVATNQINIGSGQNQIKFPDITEINKKNIVDVVSATNLNATTDRTINSSPTVEQSSAKARRRGSTRFNPSLSTSDDSGARNVNVVDVTLNQSSNRPVRRKIPQNNVNKKETLINEEIEQGNYPSSFKQFSFTNPINKFDQESTKYKENFQKFYSDKNPQRDLILNTSSNVSLVRNKPSRIRTEQNIINNTLKSSSELEIEEKKQLDGKNNFEFNNNANTVNKTYSEVISGNNKPSNNRPTRRRSNQNEASGNDGTSVDAGVEKDSNSSTLQSRSSSVNQNSSDSTKDRDIYLNTSSFRSRPSRRRSDQGNDNNSSDTFTSTAKTNVEKDYPNILRTRSRNGLTNTKIDQNAADSLINTEATDSNGKNPQRDFVIQNVKNYQDSNNFRLHPDKAKSLVENLHKEETSTKTSVTPSQDNDQMAKVTKLQWIKITPPSTNEEKFESQETNYLSRGAKTQIHSKNNPINSRENNKNIQETVTVQAPGDSKFYRISSTSVAYNSETSTLSSSFEKYGNTFISNDYLIKDEQESHFLKPPKDTSVLLSGKENFPIITETIRSTVKTLDHTKGTADIDSSFNQNPISAFRGKNYLPNTNKKLMENASTSKETSDLKLSSETSNNNRRKYQNIQRQNNITIQKDYEITENQNISQSKDAYHTLNEFHLDNPLRGHEGNKGNKDNKKINGIPQTIISLPKDVVDDNNKSNILEYNQSNINTTRGAQKHTPSRFETISPFTSDSDSKKLYAENTPTAENQSTFVPTQARRKENRPSETTERTEQTAPILPTLQIIPQKPRKEANRTSQRSEQRDATSKGTNSNANSEGKAFLRTNRGNIKYVYDSLNPDLIYGDANYPSQFSYNYKTPTGISAYQKGELKEINEQKVFIIHGSYKYTSPDGTPVLVSYTADENGFHPQETLLTDENFKIDAPTGSQDFYSQINKRKAKTIRAKQNQDGEIRDNNNSTEGVTSRKSKQVTKEPIEDADDVEHFTEKIKANSRGRHMTKTTTTTNAASDKPDYVTETTNNVSENSKKILDSIEKSIDITENYKSTTQEISLIKNQ